MRRSSVHLAILLGSMLGSFLLLFFLVAPGMHIWDSHSLTWTWMMSASGYLAGVVITRQVLLGIKPLFYKTGISQASLTSMYNFFSIGAVMSLFFHPFAALVSYGLFMIQQSLWIICVSIVTTLALVYIISVFLLKKKGSGMLHLATYPLWIGIWVHGRVDGSMAAEILGLRLFRIGVGVVLGIALGTKLIYTYRRSRSDIVHFPSLFSSY